MSPTESRTPELGDLLKLFPTIHKVSRVFTVVFNYTRHDVPGGTGVHNDRTGGDVVDDLHFSSKFVS